VKLLYIQSTEGEESRSNNRVGDNKKGIRRLVIDWYP